MTEKILKEIQAEIAELKEEHANMQVLIKDLKKELRGLIEIQKKLIHERLGVPVPPPSTEYAEPEGKKIKSIEIINFTPGRIGITGNTYEYNSAIKAAASDNGERAKWEPAPHKLWHMPEKCLESLIENLRNLDLEENKDFIVKITEKPKKEEEEGFGAGFD